MSASGDRSDAALVEAAGRVALAQGQLDLILRSTIDALSDSGVTTAKMNTWDLCSELSAQFRNRCKDTTLRTRLKAMLLECERLAEERTRLLQNVSQVAEDGAVVAKSSRDRGEIGTPTVLNRIAADITALGSVLSKARQHGFIAKAAASDCSPADAKTPPQPELLPREVLPSPRPMLARPKSFGEDRESAMCGEATILGPRSSGRVSILVCPNCQTKVVSS